MLEGVKKLWQWLRENLLYVLMIVFLQACASWNPATKQVMGELTGIAIKEALEKAKCEKSGKDWKDGKCVERVKPSEPAPTPTPSVPNVPNPVPAPVSPIPPKSVILQPGDSIDVGVSNNSVTFFIKGLVQFNEPVNRDHIWFGWKWNAGGKEVNCHFDSVNRDTHFACQRFDGGCGAAKCERHDANPVEWNPDVTYKIIVTINPDYSVHAEAWDGDKLFAAWDNTVWTNPGKVEWVKVGNPFGYPMPGIVEVSLP